MKKIFTVILVVLTAFAVVKAQSDDSRLEALGLVDVAAVCPDIEVQLIYATSANFTGVRLYETLTRAYLHPVAAESLVKAQRELSMLQPGYRLKIYDAARPMSVQKKMYDVVKGTAKAPYVSNPRNGGGLHNYGMAVDVTIVDDRGNELDMGTPVDYLGKKAGITNEDTMLKQGLLTSDQVENRRLLRRVMKHGGFTPLGSEWWHFNRCTRAYARTHYKVIE